jgi:hypothetical protein
MAFIAELDGGCGDDGVCASTPSVNANTLAAHTLDQILVFIVPPAIEKISTCSRMQLEVRSGAR